MQSDLAILNAEQFNIGVRFRTAGRRIRSSTQPEICTTDSLQAILSAQQAAGTDSMTTASAKVPSAMRETLKRASTASGEDGERDREKKRARGRPRVAVKDVTAADVCTALDAFALPLVRVVPTSSTDKSQNRDGEPRFDWLSEPIAAGEKMPSCCSRRGCRP